MGEGSMTGGSACVKCGQVLELNAASCVKCGSLVEGELGATRVVVSDDRRQTAVRRLDETGIVKPVREEISGQSTGKREDLSGWKGDRVLVGLCVACLAHLGWMLFVMVQHHYVRISFELLISAVASYYAVGYLKWSGRAIWAPSVVARVDGVVWHRNTYKKLQQELLDSLERDVRFSDVLATYFGFKGSFKAGNAECRLGELMVRICQHDLNRTILEWEVRFDNPIPAAEAKLIKSEIEQKLKSLRSNVESANREPRYLTLADTMSAAA